MLIERRGKATGKQNRRATDKKGIATCDMQGDLWELDALFLGYMKEMVQGWCGGSVPENVMQDLKNYGHFQAEGFIMRAEPKNNGRIFLHIEKD
ncbi:hypothetical protein [Aliamphritea ceti]|uniref:hypothetical protein n=1 Tax=Aliamphritea ceti TaxID=1524258 RepID=UPI0021C2EB84|nr:hypothetical protein [Aliamphritea ceti]